MAAEIREIRERQLAEGCERAEKPIYTPHGIVILSAPNWAAIADVLDAIERKH